MANGVDQEATMQRVSSNGGPPRPSAPLGGISLKKSTVRVAGSAPPLASSRAAVPSAPSQFATSPAPFMTATSPAPSMIAASPAPSMTATTPAPFKTTSSPAGFPTADLSEMASADVAVDMYVATIWPGCCLAGLIATFESDN